MNDQNSDTFCEKLEELQEFPCTFPFKFIVPVAQLETAKALFPEDTVSIRHSSGGKYASITASIHVESAAIVRAVYEKAACIKGLIAL